MSEDMLIEDSALEISQTPRPPPQMLTHEMYPLKDSFEGKWKGHGPYPVNGF